MSPYTAYLHSLGLETLQLRYNRAGSNALELARHLQTLPQIKRVNYPGLTDSKFYKLAHDQFGGYPGALLTFELESRDSAFQFLNRLQLIKRSTNLYDNKTLIIHPASTIFSDFEPSVKEAIGIREEMIRLSAGIEDTDDIIEDIHSAL
jgi:O-acetylhomoserine (thiol)-lyase